MQQTRVFICNLKVKLFSKATAENIIIDELTQVGNF